MLSSIFGFNATYTTVRKIEEAYADQFPHYNPMDEARALLRKNKQSTVGLTHPDTRVYGLYNSDYKLLAVLVGSQQAGSESSGNKRLNVSNISSKGNNVQAATHLLMQVKESILPGWSVFPPELPKPFVAKTLKEEARVLKV